MEKVYIVVQCNSSYDNNSSQNLVAFKNKASADHYKQDKECDYVGMKHIYFYISEIELR